MRGALTSPRWGYAAAGWAALFAAVHLYWALGGATGLAESAGQDLAEDRPAWFVALGLYGVAVAVHVLLLSDAGYGGGAISAARRTWTLVVWDPWFLVGGVLFGTAALAARPDGRPATSWLSWAQRGSPSTLSHVA